MKHINQYFIGALLLSATALSFTSCDLDEYNPSSEGATATFASPQGMENLVNQLYYNYKWKYFGREDPVLYFEGAGDIWANVPEKNEYGMQLTRFVNLQGDRGQVKGAWERNYDNINVANNVLQYLPSTKNINDAPKLKISAFNPLYFPLPTSGALNAGVPHFFFNPLEFIQAKPKSHIFGSKF